MTAYRLVSLGAALLGILTASLVGCKSNPSGVSSGDMRFKIVVSVSWDGQGVPGHEVSVVETGATASTNEAGLAVFEVRPGDYTVRIFGLNHGGPVLRAVDYPVSIVNADAHVDAIDCLPCV